MHTYSSKTCPSIFPIINKYYQKCLNKDIKGCLTNVLLSTIVALRREESEAAIHSRTVGEIELLQDLRILRQDVLCQLRLLSACSIRWRLRRHA